MRLAVMMLLPLAAAAQDTTVRVSIDVSAARHGISNDIYGINDYGTDGSLAKELSLPVIRRGGDATTQYNWLVDSSNSGDDWFFMGGSGTANVVPGQSADQFVQANRGSHSKTVLTIPMIGFVNATSQWNCSFPVSKYGLQRATNPYIHPGGDDCGDGRAPDGSLLTKRDPLENHVANSPDFQKAWVQHLVGTFGKRSEGGVSIYEMDNEPSGWGNTHRDVHPASTGYDELRDLTYAYGAMVKSVDDSAQILGPGDFGWAVYIASLVKGDKEKHSNTGFAEWYLQQMKAFEDAHGYRLLDYFDEHYYPTVDGMAVANSAAGNAATQAARLRSTRSLWDPAYKDESWIGSYYEPIRLIPRFHEWVDRNYPGTKLSITEYNWGGLEDINGALAQADVLGIFGRERLDLATLWGPPKPADPGAFAFRMYLNYDGRGGRFGDVSVQATSTDSDTLAVFAAQRSADGALTAIFINKTSKDVTASVSLANLPGASGGQTFVYSPADLGHISGPRPLTLTATGWSSVFPANSLTMAVATSAATPADPGHRGRPHIRLE